MERNLVARAVAGAGALTLWMALALAAAQAQDKIYVMKVTLPTLGDPSYQFAKNYAAALERDSGGRIKPAIYPASQLGSIPRQIEGTQFGAIQCAVIPPEFFVGVDERFELMAAPGLVDSMQHAQHLAADAQVRKLMLGLGADKGLHGVGLFMNSPSSLIAKAPIRRLANFKGKKIRVFASQFQTVAFERLGATPVAMTLGDVLPAGAGALTLWMALALAAAPRRSSSQTGSSDRRAAGAGQDLRHEGDAPDGRFNRAPLTPRWGESSFSPRCIFKMRPDM